MTRGGELEERKNKATHGNHGTERERTMTTKLHKALESVVPHVGEGSQIFILEGGVYHRFRVEEGRLSHTESHSGTHVEPGRGPLNGRCGRRDTIHQG